MKTVFEYMSQEIYSFSAETIGFIPMEVGNWFYDIDIVYQIISKSLELRSEYNGSKMFYSPTLVYTLEKR